MLLTSSWIPDLILFLITTAFLAYVYSTRHFNHWKKRNVFFHKPSPFFGNFKDVALMKTTIGQWLRSIYNATKEPFFGIWVFDEPYLVVKDPSLVKNIIIKDFNHFSDRTAAWPEHDSVSKHLLFFMPNPQWKANRAQMSPSFTSGKLKTMFPTINGVGERLQKYLNEHQGTLEAKEVAAKYSTDVIAKTFFGINAHCFDNEDAIFRKLGKSIFDFTLRNAFVATAYFSMPNLVRWFKLDFVVSWARDYFSTSFMEAFEAREKSNVRMNDFIDILKDLKKKEEARGEFDVDKLKGAGMQFFLAGFETTSSTISFALHELCLNRNVQNKLRQEILSSIRKDKGLTYEGVLGMKYLDQVIKETLRKYPVLPFLDRRCVEDYKLPGTDVLIEKGSSVYLPVYGLHYDEKYFPEPETFDPERFANNKNYNADGLVYMPFGEGPRICIGERLGLLSTKLGIIAILSKFEVEKCDTTPNPIQFEPKSLVLASNIGLPMTFKYLVPSPA